MRVWIVVVLCACGSVSEKKPDARVADAPEVDTPIDAPAWTPARLSGLALWLSADHGVTASSNNVVAWADRSTFGNNATQIVTERQPTLVANGIGAHPVIRFNGQNMLQIADSASLQWGTGDFTIEMVASWKNATSAAPGYAMLVSKQTSGTGYPGASLWGNFTVPSLDTVLGAQIDTSNYARSTTNALNDGVVRVLGGRRVGTTLEVRVGGAAAGNATVGSVDVNAVGFPMYIGGQPNGGTAVYQALDGDVAEIVLVKGPLSAADLAELETYLKTKYGL
jgi:hypothetical protein